MKRMSLVYGLAVIISVSTASGPISGVTRPGNLPVHRTLTSEISPAGAESGSSGGPLGYAYDHL